MTTFLKFVHIATIAVWSGGLIVLPYLFWQRRLLAAGPELDRLHRITRFVYVVMTSPAAFVAIIWVVLAKPDIDSTQFAAELFEPGALAPWLRQIFGVTSTPTP